ncbi:hypothetical protein [Polaribacter septentrionalilitoris]|uniref:hypothetical protein n=1 Tax=Polaribacter septentrionalilitoris TaxID=2494657 RepID=UPI00135B6F41|nr:hypothetical protein [Polaribacter septentrionalilitoris]
MKINLKTRSINTDSGVFIKKLTCKYNITEEDLKKDGNKNIIGNCNYCQKGVYKTEKFTDEELQTLVKKDPNICFYVNKSQSNISKIEVGELLYFNNLQGASTIECFDCGFETESFLTNLRTESNRPCQCQECGMIYENLADKTCSHKCITSKKPLFCISCKSTNVKVGQLIIG